MNQITSHFNHQPKSKQQVFSNDTGISSLKGWMRKLEQSNGSLSSRLLAVENRISLLPHYTETQLAGDRYHDHTLTQNDVSLATKGIDPSQDHIISQLTSLNQEILDLKEKITRYEDHIADVEEQKQQLQSHLQDIEGQYRKHAVIMKVHGREIPLEITGIIGGFLAFLIAGLVLFGGKDIIMTPLFLGIIGSVLIGSSIFRSMHKQPVLQTIFKHKSMDQRT